LKRLFYVAATRARKRLYLSASVDATRGPASGSMLRLLWANPELRQRFQRTDAQIPELAGAAAHDGTPQLLKRFPSTLTVPPRPQLPEPLVWSTPRASSATEQHRFEWVGDVLPRVGVVTHSFLQRIAIETPLLWTKERLQAARPAIATALANLGVAPGDLEQGTRRVVDALQRTLGDERGRWLLSSHLEHRCELALSAIVDGELQHIRIDRTFIESGTRWVIDYKITEQQGGDSERFIAMQVEKYRPDMQRYACAVRALDVRAGTPHPVRCALYLPLQSRWCEIDLAGTTQGP
jgi:ATP-dependent exoDNAse (exonuclease V) beta subunit